jgi:hypothetical protein
MWFFSIVSENFESDIQLRSYNAEQMCGFTKHRVKRAHGHPQKSRFDEVLHYQLESQLVMIARPIAAVGKRSTILENFLWAIGAVVVVTGCL